MSVKPLIRPTFDKKQLMLDVAEESSEATGILSAVITIPDFIHEIKRFESTPLLSPSVSDVPNDCLESSYSL